MSGCETTNLFRQVLKGVNLFSEIFGNYWKILSGCETANLFRQVIKGMKFFRKFSEIIGKYCQKATRISSDRFLKGEFSLEIFGNYWKILSGCETTDLFSQVIKGVNFFVGNFRKLLENIFGVRDDESLQTCS